MGTTDGSRREAVLRIWPNVTVIDDSAGREATVIRPERTTPIESHPLYFVARRHDLRLIVAGNMPEKMRHRRFANLGWLVVAGDLSPLEIVDIKNWLADCPPRRP